MYAIKAKQTPGGSPYGSVHSAIPKPDLTMENIEDDTFIEQPRLKWVQNHFPLADANHRRPDGAEIEVVEDIEEIRYRTNGFQDGPIARKNKEEVIKKGKT